MADNITACNTMLHAKLTDAIRAGQLMEFVYHLGHVRLEMATAYTDFRNVILLLLQLVKWMECRVCNSISLVKAYQGFLQAVEPLADGFHGLDSGTVSRPAMIQLHNDAKQAKAELKAAYDL